MIPIRNIYYMLSYAYEKLRQNGYTDLASEDFESVDDLYAAIMERCVKYQIQRGIHRDYIDKKEEITTIKGKIETSETIKSQALIRKKIVCCFDEYSMNTNMNKIAKAAMMILVKSRDVKNTNKKELRRILQLFDEVDDIDVRRIDWQKRYNRNNDSYRLLMGLSYLIIQRRLQTEKQGKELMNFFDDQKMWDLYEHFVLNYYRRHFPELNPLPAHVEWNTDDGFTDLLPTMRTDITLSFGDKTLIIDTKFFEAGILKTNGRYDGGAKKIASENVYQVYSYVKNKDKDRTGKVAGMLLYAKTTSDPVLDQKYNIDGNMFFVRTLDLDQDFRGIARDLNDIAELVRN